jgi:hypothetical protein
MILSRIETIAEPKGLYMSYAVYILDISYFYVSEYKRW